MATIIISFVIGMFVGGFIGILAASLCQAASRNAADSDTPEYY